MEKLISLLRFSLGISPEFEHKLTADEWTEMLNIAHRQALVGVLFCGVRRLGGQYAPPLPLMLQWTAEAERICGMNHAFNQKAKALTGMFAAENRQSFILKGQANARLYPEPLSRQPGDIDIYVSGGKKSVLNMLVEKGMMEKDAFVSYHHAHLHNDSDDITVEVHFRPSSGVFYPWGNKKLQNFLDSRISNISLCDDGFYIPDMPFALIMQLAHIQKHFMGSGIGLRQIMDYYYLLCNASQEHRQTVAQLLKPFSLIPFAGGLMWLIKYLFDIDESLMLCQPDEGVGRKISNEIFHSGNFGWYSGFYNESFLKRYFRQRLRVMKLFFTFPKEMFWGRMSAYKFFVQTIPLRIRYRKLSLKDVDL